MTSHKSDIQTLAQLVLLLTALQALPAIAVEPPQRFSTTSASNDARSMPKLIIGITIDQLRTDYLDILQSRFGQGGFRRLMQEGSGDAAPTPHILRRPVHRQCNRRILVATRPVEQHTGRRAEACLDADQQSL